MKKNTTPRQTLTAPLPRPRFAIVAFVFIVWGVLIAGKLFWLQIVQHQHWVGIAARQQTGAFEVAPRRGVLYD
jgi:cell division protein FtsI (penicillin-binding protein 3)